MILSDNYINVLLYAHTTQKVSKYGVISGPSFPVFGPEITPYLNAFHAVTR